ncbi:MAG: prepilin-type cleavage/methylation domain-containing protein [Magnetococcales bacterium]|nr:prepilin-type cleavage/methylation domain-containing protein [Magnetococcales bacterium]
MLILSLLLGGVLLPLSTQWENSQRRETKEQLERLHEALLGFALVHGHLPCPDIDRDGREDRQGAGCAGNPTASLWQGTIPWLTLGVGEEDAWHNRFTYAVSKPFTDDSKAPWPAFTLASTGTIQVVNGIDHTPAVFLSHGANGLGALSALGVTNPPPRSPSEQENSNGDARFVHAPYHTDREQGFDDQLFWISPNILFNRLLLAGRLPPENRAEVK